MVPAYVCVMASRETRLSRRRLTVAAKDKKEKSTSPSSATDSVTSPTKPKGRPAKSNNGNQNSKKDTSQDKRLINKVQKSRVPLVRLDTSDLDLSSDFTGGCSPFKHTASKAVEKGRQQCKRKNTEQENKARKASKASSSKDNDKAINSNSNNSSSSHDENKPDKAVKDTDKESDFYDIDSLRHEQETGNGLKKCSTCSELIPSAAFSKHTVLCLRNKFERKPSKGKS